MKIKTNRKGFTVVELVIVIAVIGILSAVLIPTFSGLITKAQNSALQQGLSNAYTGYVAEIEVADAENLLAKNEILLSKDDAETVYKFDTTENKWVVAEASTGNEFVVAGDTEYNGYKVCKEQPTA